MAEPSITTRGAYRRPEGYGRRTPTPRWAVAEIRRLEDLRDAVHGAGLEAVQYSKGTLRGSLAVAEYLGATFTVARVESHIAIRGPLSPDRS